MWRYTLTLAATVLFAVVVVVVLVFEGTDALDTALEGREVTVRVVVLLAVDKRELGFGAAPALPVVGLGAAVLYKKMYKKMCKNYNKTMIRFPYDCPQLFLPRH